MRSHIGEVSESAEGARLLSEYTGLNLYRGFKSLPLRQQKTRQLVLTDCLFSYRAADIVRRSSRKSPSPLPGRLSGRLSFPHSPIAGEEPGNEPAPPQRDAGVYSTCVLSIDIISKNRIPPRAC